MFRTITMASALAAASLPGAERQQVLGPEAAIAAADASRNGYHGRFAMIVLNADKWRRATYLNSTADYRAPDTLTFRLAPNVAGVLTRRFGVPAEQYLKGKRVTVEGIARRQLIVNMEHGRVKSFNRWTHEVYVRLPGQVIAVE